MRRAARIGMTKKGVVEPVGDEGVKKRQRQQQIPHAVH